MANWMSAQDVFKQLSKNEASVLTGKAIVDYVDNIYKTDAKEVQQAAHRMAEAMAKQGHAAQASIMEIEREAAKAGFIPEFSYDATTHQITMRLSRQKGVPGDKGKTSIKPITVKLDVGSPKAGLNKGVPATQSLSAQAEEAGAYFATQLENQLDAIKNTLKARNKSGSSKGISTAAFKHQINEAVKKGVQSLISHTTHVAVDSDIFADEMYEGDSRARQLFLQSNLRMAGAINSAIAKVRSKFGNIKRKTKSGNELELDDDYIARAIQTYIMVAQSKLGEGAARQTLRKRGIEDGIIDVIKIHLGDILNLSNTANFGSDRSLRTMTISSRGGRENLLGNYGEKSRHAQQGQNYLKKVFRGNRGFEKVFREINLDAEGFYDDAAQLMYTTAQFDAKSVKTAYETAKKVIRKEIEQEIRKKSKNKTEDQIQEIIEKRVRSMFGDFDPSVYDDMSIIRKSTLGDLTSVRTRTGSIDEKRYKILETEAAEVFGKKIAGLKNGKSEFRYNGTTFNKADRGGFIEKYIASKVISGLKPGDIQFLTTEATKNENGDIVGYNIIAEQLVGAMAQQVKTVTDQGERNYAKGLSDRVFTEMLIQLGINPKEAEKIDFIKNKESLKSNNLAHRAIGRLSYLFNKTQDKSGFTKLLKNSPIGALLRNVGSGSIQFAETPEALEAFAKAGGLTALYKWMEENEWDSEKIFDSSAPLIYSHTANLADVFDWTKRVQTGSKERVAQLRTAGASGSSQAYREAIERRYNKTSGRGAEVVKKAQHDIAQIESALYEKTAQTAAMSKKEAVDYIKNQSFKSGGGDFSKHAITMGAGDSYSINTNLFKDIIAEYENGHISEAEFAKTWEGEVERIRNEMIAGGVNPDDIDVVFDPGQIFGFSDKYGDQYSGRLLHLGSIGANKHIDPLTGETVYDRFDYSSDVNALMKAVAGKGKNKQGRVSEAVHDVIMGMFKTAESNSGSLNERATKRRLGHSHSFHTSGISPEQIGNNVDENRLIDSGFVSATAMKKLLMDTYDYEDESGNINEQEYLQTLLTQLNAARNSSEEYKDYFEGLDTFEEKQKKIVDALMGVAKDVGLSGMFNRFPSIDSEAVKNSRLFISESIKDDDIMAVGAGLAKAINADFDGDTINVILKMIDTLAALSQGTDGKLFDPTEKFDRAVIKDIYQMYMASEKTGEKSTDLSEELKKADDDFFNQLSGIAAKVNNINIGTFSNMSTRIRNSLSGTPFDESALIKTEDGVDYNSARNVAKGLLIKAVGQTLEQDAISSKKVEARISQKFLKLKEAKGGELTQEEKDQIVAETLNEYEELINRIIAGDFTDDSDFLKALEEMGIAKNGKIESLGMRTAVSQIKNLGLEKAQTVALFKDVLGVDEATAKQIMTTGEVDTTSLGGVMKSTSMELFEKFGEKHGFFWGDQYNRPVASSREFGKGTKSDEYELMRLMKYEGYGQNVEAVTEGNKAFGERGEILKEVIDAYKDEIALEEKKIGVAGKEANAIKKLGTTWADYAKYINDTYDIAKEAATLQDKNSKFYVESKESLDELGLERISPSTIRNIMDPRSNMTTGVDESFLRRVKPLIKTYIKGATEQQRAEARNRLLDREGLAATYGIESGAVLDKTLSGAIATAGGSYAGAVAQEDKGTARKAKKKLELLLYALGKTVDEVSETIEVFKTAGKNMKSVANRFGETVGNEIPIAGISENGQYLIGGRMDTVRRSGGEDNSVYTVLDYKTHMGGNASAEDIVQVLVYQEVLKAVQKQLQNADDSASNKDLLNLFQTEIAKALSVFGLSEGREGLINSFTEEDIGRLRKKTTQIKSGLVVADSRTGATSAYELASYLPANVRDIILGGDWHSKTDAEKASILAQAKKVTRSGYYKPGMETAVSKEEERNKTQKEYVELLEREYDLKLKLEKWKKDYGAQEGSSAYKLLLDQKNKEITDAENASKEMAKKAGLDPNKNDLLSRYEAEHQLKLAEMANKAAGGSGGTPQKQSIWNQLGWNKDGLTRAITQFFSLYRILGKVRQTIQKVITITKQLDQAATNIRIVTGQTREEVDTTILSYSKLAKELGSTTVELANSANTWLRQGYSVAESMDLIAASTKLSKLGMLDMGSATKVLTSTLKGFKMEANEATTIVDKLTKLDMNYAASAGEIGEAMARTSAIASQMGMSLDETAAMVTTIMDVTQQSSEMAGTAVRSILSRYGNVKSGSFLSMMTGDEEDLEKINDIEKVLNVLGISIRTSKMEMRNMGDVLDELALKWNTLSSVEQNAVATAFAGVRQRNFFQVMLSNWDRVREAQEIAANSAGTTDEKYGAYLDSIEANVKKLQNAWENFTQSLNNNILIKGFLKTTTFIVENFGRITTALLTLFTVLNAYKVPGWISGLFGRGKGAMVGGLTSASTNMALATGKSKRELGLTKIGDKIDKAATRIVNAIKGSNGSGSLSSFKLGTKESVNREIQKIQYNSKLSPEEKKTRINDLKNWRSGKGYWTTNTKGQEVGAVYRDGAFYNISTGKKINPNSKIGKQLAAQKSTATKAKIGNVGAAGVMGALSGYATGPQDSLGVWKRGDVSINDIENTQADKIANGIFVGGLTAIGSMFGPLGAMLGGVIGGEVGNLIKWLTHKDEMDRKQRVEDAKKDLEALNKIESATQNVSKAVYDLSSASAVNEARKAIEDLIYEISNSEKPATEILEKLEDLDWFNLDNWQQDLYSILLSDNSDRKQAIIDGINGALAEDRGNALYRSQEEDRYSAKEKYDKAIEDIEDNDDYSDLEKEKKKKEAYDVYKNTLSSLDRKLWSTELESAFYKSGLSSWNLNEIRGDNLENVVQIFANSLELTGQQVRTYGGELTSAARQQIEAFLRANDRFNIITQTSTKTLNQLKKNATERNNIETKLNTSYEKLHEVADRAGGNEESFNELKKWADSLGWSTEELRKKIYEIDNGELSRLAVALNTTEENLLGFSKELGMISLSDALKTPEELRVYAEDLGSIFSQLASKGRLFGETLDKVNNSYFFLYNKYDEEGKLLSVGQENVLDNLYQMLFVPDSTIKTLYTSSMFNQYADNATFFENFKNNNQAVMDELKKIGQENATTLRKVLPQLSDNEIFTNALAQQLSAISNEGLLMNELRDSLISWQTHDNEVEINNLQEIIKSLKEVNEERKNELELIKAKDALENAKNEKKRVYRAGIGWTYESDMKAVQEAQENLETLERDKNAENFQYQVDLLEQQNDILNNITKNEELEALKDNFEQYSKFMKDTFGVDYTNSFSAITKLAESYKKGSPWEIDWSGYTKILKEAQDQRVEKATGDLKVFVDEMNAYQGDITNADITKGNKSRIEAQRGLYNSYQNFLIAKQKLKDEGYTDNEIATALANSGFTENEDKYDKKAISGKTDEQIFAGEGLLNATGKALGKEIGKWYGEGSSQGIKIAEQGGDQDNLLYSPEGNLFTVSDLVGNSNELSEIINEWSEDWDNDNFLAYLNDEGKWVLVKRGNGQVLTPGTTDQYEYYKTPTSVDNLIKQYQLENKLLALGGGGTTGWGDNDLAYAVKDGNGWRMVTQIGKRNALGTYNFSGGPSLINELGTEGIVTPQGTITALPSHTGIVPADLTRNLFQLGEVAPNLIKGLSSIKTEANRFNSTEDNSMHVNDLNITVHADSDFNFNKLLSEARQYMAITRHNNK